MIIRSLKVSFILLLIIVGTLSVSLIGLYYKIGSDIDDWMSLPVQIQYPDFPTSVIRAMDLEFPNQPCKITLRLREPNCYLEGQLAKTFPMEPKRSLKYAFDNVLAALYLSNNYSKSEIKEVFINRAYWGTRDTLIEGITSAARIYFNKEVAQLSDNETAELFVLLKSPSYFSNPMNSERLELEKKRFLEAM